MTIDIHIAQLLNNNKIVVITDFGGFKLRYIPAKLVSSDHNMEPPRNEVIFDKELLYKDDTLINQIIKAEKIERNEAEELIQQFISSIKERVLVEKGEFHIKGLGYFHQGTKNDLVFVSELKTDFLPEAYGLSSYEFQPVHPEQTEKTTLEKKQKPVNEGANGSSLLMWIVIAVAASVFGMLITLTQFTNITPELKIDFSFLDLDYDYQYLDSNEFVGLLDTMEFEGYDDEADIEISSPIEKSIDNMTEMQNALKFDVEEESEVKKETVIIEKTIDSVYYIIAGSFATNKSAVALKQKLIYQGYNDTEVIHSDNRYRVSIYSFSRKQIALDKLYSIRKVKGRHNCWLLKQKV